MLFQTEHGRLRIDRANDDLLFKLRGWPKGIRRLENVEQELYGIFFGDRLGEQWGVKINFGYTEDKEYARVIYWLNRLLVPEAIAMYAEYGFDGIFMPFAYSKTHKSGSTEVGYIMFAHSNSRSNFEMDPGPIELYEQMFGTGATNMLFGFINASGLVWNATGKQKRTINEFCVAKLSSLGSVGLDFLVVGSDIVCLHGTTTYHYQPFYDRLTKSGARRIYHLPSVAARCQGESAC